MTNVLTKPFNRQTRNLLFEMVRTDFKLRYQSSVLGYLWSILKPLFIFSILYAVFTVVLKIGAGIPGYPVYLLTGVFMWSFFVEATNRSVATIVSKGTLIRKISMPKYLVVLSTVINSLINFLISSVIIVIFLVITSGTVTNLAMLPLIFLLMAELFIFATAIAFILSAAYVKFRDVSYIWEVAAQGLFYASAIIYPLQIVPAGIQGILLLNPVAQIIHDARRILVLPDTVQVYDVLPWPLWLAPFIITLIVVVFAIYYFKSQSKEFAENV
jgi:ABC-2 type transport system permease protein